MTSTKYIGQDGVSFGSALKRTSLAFEKKKSPSSLIVGSIHFGIPRQYPFQKKDSSQCGAPAE
jgi:hypothetical protein